MLTVCTPSSAVLKPVYYDAARRMGEVLEDALQFANLTPAKA